MSFAITTNNQDIERKTVIKRHIVIPADFSDPYMIVSFPIPQNTVKVGVRSSHQKSNHRPRVYISLFDPNHYRGTQMNYLENGNVAYDLWVTDGSSALGCIPGSIREGEWRVQFDISKLDGPADIYLEVYYELNRPHEKQKSPFFDERVIKSTPGFYCGELHAHSEESDGDLSVGELIIEASESELDFLSISDHFTVSQWYRVVESDLPEIILLNSLEITSQHGHANLQGVKRWVDVFIDRNDWNVNDAAEETHKQGGLFCINHAFSSDLGWRHFDLDWKNVDLFEIYHSLEGPNNISQIGMWDALLRAGFRIIGVSGTDCHNPKNEIERLGRVLTWVYANELSAEGIINGLKTGRVYVSFGPKIDFSLINSKGAVAEMGGEIKSYGQPLELSISLESMAPLRVMIIKNGFFLDSIIFEPNGERIQSFELIDKDPCPGYYRIEFHDLVKDQVFTGIEWRDYKTIKALSNPIWVD